MTEKRKISIVSATATTSILAAIIVATVATASILVGCDKVENDKYKNLQEGWCFHGIYCRTKVVEIESHKYILMDGCDGGGIIHSASCECMNK